MPLPLTQNDDAARRIIARPRPGGSPTQRTVLALVLLLGVLSSCARSTTEPPALASLPGARATSSTILDRGLRALDDVGQPLDALGFIGGRERVYVGAAGTFERAVTRAMAFEDADGAIGYVRWIATNASDLIGTADRVASPQVGRDAVAYVHEPSDCCPGKDLPRFLLAWRRGAVVLFVDARGKAMTLRRATAMATDLDART